ncbi:apelin receptor early endogenous ligand [Nothoprocta perdicaria]|uniref:Apelin receptor early endogenous ligand n=1 Tax=Nothoprocta perdicaria TaxID=30464 RepID=A0A8C6YMC8_NOTPE|nr:apelin receptor early endogenous ligand [Nothoprocta perdicaria]
MRLQRLLRAALLLCVTLLLAAAQRPGSAALRRKLHRHGCLQRRCVPLHSRVPFP